MPAALTTRTATIRPQHGQADALTAGVALLVLPAWICWTACAVLNALFSRPQAARVPAASPR